MKEPIDYRALALQALQVKPSGEWGCSDLQRHYTLSYSQAVHLLEAIKEVASDDMGEEPPATAEGQPEQFADLTPFTTADGKAQQVNTFSEPGALLDAHSTLQQTTMPSVTEALARERERLSPTGRASRSDKGKPRGPKPKPTAPESAPEPAPAPKPLKVGVGVGVDLATPEGMEDLMSLLAVWVYNKRSERIVSLVSHLAEELVKARKEIARLTTPAA